MGKLNDKAIQAAKPKEKQASLLMATALLSFSSCVFRSKMTKDSDRR